MKRTIIASVLFVVSCYMLVGFYNAAIVIGTENTGITLFVISVILAALSFCYLVFEFIADCIHKRKDKKSKE